MIMILYTLLICLAMVSDVSSGQSKAEWTLQTLSGILCKRDYQRVAFSANLKSHYTTQGNDHLVFANVIANVGGDYDPTTGTFTCRVPGLYQFSWMIHQTKGRANSHFYLVRNNDVVFTMYHTGSNDNIACTTYLQLKYGDTVWLKAYEAGRTIFANNYTTFGGMLV
ncbi:hypothetical protein FSP39_009703 [Pinctada imbricata]|uniref:C1q domain-containing protein n=1 Tax=Pinctada imbricata TaxID=66713 RepID=A0AA88YDQ7_PINIB|nr:hypothetical protein FSP39_009703 [Pinctada imbricata]